ncbi:MAG: 23S rRNA (adenine(2503)-C(2))-methyltransferase RlmN [Spirochaetaceae bacterium]|nr:23S rRNA (adenine(2503)-C(2))-methyltransferase RlmN [Spirochaetaceae bacterium]
MENKAHYFLAGFFPEEIVDVFHLEKSFQGLQIYKWIANGTKDFSDMTNLSKPLREKLAKDGILRSSHVTQKLVDPDGTIKLQITLYDGSCVETVLLIDDKERKTACVSCQVGCGMGCAFCMTGRLGFSRNLFAAEIVEQFLYLEEIVGKLDNIVFMGMGEPMLNLKEIRKAIAILTDKRGRNLSGRRITISTSGVIQGIYDLADNGPHVRLAVSLTCANQELREKIMPIAKTNTLPELKKAILYFIEKTGKRCTLEAALMKNVNTSNESAQELVNFAKNMDVHVNLIPWNPIEILPFQEPTTQECKNFLKYLDKNNITVTIRTKRGRKIGGACGQLGKLT